MIVCGLAHRLTMMNILTFGANQLLLDVGGERRLRKVNGEAYQTI